MQELKKTLETEQMEATWSALKPHAEREALILVAPELSLSDVGVALAHDDTPTVERWIAQGLVAKPSPPQIAAWDEGGLKFFWMLIVQPFVLVQELSPEEQAAILQENRPST